MRKFVLLVFLIGLSIALGFSWQKGKAKIEQNRESSVLDKAPILRFALVADSEDENELLKKALSQAKGAGVNFVIGLGGFKSLGTLEQLSLAEEVFEHSQLTYFVTAGDHDLWDSRNRADEATTNFRQVFGQSSHFFEKQGIQFVILDNSDIYSGIKDAEISNIKFQISNSSTQHKLTFVFAHKTPFHPQSEHVMGENSEEVSAQARKLMDLLQEKEVEGFFSGDLHFFAQFNSPDGNVKMTTIGAVNSARNFQGPRFAIVTVYSDYSWEVEDVEIR